MFARVAILIVSAAITARAEMGEAVSGDARALARDGVTLRTYSLQTCASFVEGPEVCWGVRLAPAIHHHCAITDGKVECWGQDSEGETRVPPLDTPTQVTDGMYHSCALTAKGVVCWGNNRVGQLNVPEIKNPRSVAAGAHFTCASDDTGIRCWGWWEGRSWPIPTSPPTQLVANLTGVCAVEEDRVECWGRNDEHQTDVPAEVNERIEAYYGFTASSLEKDLGKLSRRLYRRKQAFVAELATAVRPYPVPWEFHPIAFRSSLTRYFALELLGPVLEWTPAQYVREKVLPKYKLGLEKIREQLVIKGLNDVEINPQTVRLALAATRGALHAAERYSPEKSVAGIHDLLARLAGVEAAARNGEKPAATARHLLSELHASHPLVEALLSESRTRGFAGVLKKLEGALDKK